MGWASGSMLLIKVAGAAAAANLPPSVKFWEKVVDAFENHDCDTINEATGIRPDLDVAIYKRTVDWMKKEGYEDSEDEEWCMALEDLNEAKKRLQKVVAAKGS